MNTRHDVKWLLNTMPLVNRCNGSGILSRTFQFHFGPHSLWTEVKLDLVQKLGSASICAFSLAEKTGQLLRPDLEPMP